jgi:4'-phosphopantetheinyl transferase
MNQAFIQPWQSLREEMLADRTVLHLITWEYPSPQSFHFPWETWLDPAEKRRADGIAHAFRRLQFLIARAVLRWCVAQSLAQAPAQLQFGYSNQAKPFLMQDPKLFFNLSHSGDLGLLALWSEGEVGVDLEQHHPVISHQVLRRIAHPVECQAILASEQPLKDQAGLRLWVRKEALAKVRGGGIFNTRQFPSLPVTSLFQDCVEPIQLLNLQLVDIPGLASATAALAWEGNAKRVCLWQLKLDQLS